MGTRLMPSTKDLEDEDSFICIDMTRPKTFYVGLESTSQESTSFCLILIM